MANSKEFKLEVKTVGIKLQALRKQHMFVQEDLAQFLGVTRSGYASIERGTYGTRIEVLAKIIIFYSKHGIDVSMEDLIGLNLYLNRKKFNEPANDKEGALMKEVELLQKQIASQERICKLLEKDNKRLEKSLASTVAG